MIGKLANAHPNDHVNRGQSSNDVIPSAIHIAAAETAQQVTSEALQIHGAAGYGRTLPLERMMRDARMFAIGGGTLEMMRNLVADRILGSHVDWRRA